jgi:hypothetical protein
MYINLVGQARILRAWGQGRFLYFSLRLLWVGKFTKQVGLKLGLGSGFTEYTTKSGLSAYLVKGQARTSGSGLCPTYVRISCANCFNNNVVLLFIAKNERRLLTIQTA